MEIFEIFRTNKSSSSIIRRNKGVKADGYMNLSYVPRNCKESECLYVGSVKKGIHTRFKQHLGYGNSGRTGALYLNRILRDFNKPIESVFTANIFEPKVKKFTEHMERVFCYNLRPIIGKRAVNNNM